MFNARAPIEQMFDIYICLFINSKKIKLFLKKSIDKVGNMVYNIYRKRKEIITMTEKRLYTLTTKRENDAIQKWGFEDKRTLKAFNKAEKIRIKYGYFKETDF